MSLPSRCLSLVVLLLYSGCATASASSDSESSPAQPAPVAATDQTDSEQADSKQTENDKAESEQAESEQAESEQAESEQAESEQTAKPTPFGGAIASYRETQRLVAEARTARTAGDTKLAETLLDEALELSPAHVVAVREKAELCRSRGAYDEALVVIRVAQESRPGVTHFVLEEAITEYDQGQLDECIETLTEFLTPEHRSPEARLLLAKAFARKGDAGGVLAAVSGAADSGLSDNELFAREPLLKPYKLEPEFQMALRAMYDERVRLSADPEKVPMLYDVPESRSGAELLSRMQGYLRSGTKFEFNLEARDFDGQMHKAADYEGKKLITFTWGTWSPTAWKMIPELVKIRREFASEGLEILLMDWENTPMSHEAMVKYVSPQLTKAKVDLPSVVLTPEDFKRFYLQGSPMMYFVADGGVVYYTLGYVSPAALRLLVRQFLAGPDEEIPIPEAPLPGDPPPAPPSPPTPPFPPGIIPGYDGEKTPAVPDAEPVKEPSGSN